MIGKNKWAKNMVSLADFCVICCVLINTIDIILIGFSIFSRVAVVFGTVAFICFTIEGKRLEQ